MSAATAAAAEACCPFCHLVMDRVTTGHGIEQIGSSGVYHFEPVTAGGTLSPRLSLTALCQVPMAG